MAEKAGKLADSAPVFCATLEEIVYVEEKKRRRRCENENRERGFDDNIGGGDNSGSGRGGGGGGDANGHGGDVDSPPITPRGAALANAPLPRVLASMLGGLDRSGALRAEVGLALFTKLFYIVLAHALVWLDPVFWVY